jgi:hypothetical protein
MNDIIRASIDVIGGMDRWNEIRHLSFDFSCSGAGLHARGPVGDAATRLPMRVTVDTREQDVAFEPFLATGQRGRYTPRRTTVEAVDGALVEALDDPRGSLTAMTPGTPWSAPQMLYFFGYSLWLYHTLPFNLLKPGVEAEEVEPWIEDGETWRGVRIRYPEDFPSHTSEQTHYFDDEGFMRRQDYTVDVRQGLSAAHYLLDYREFDGLKMPTKRRIFARGEDLAPNRDRLLIAADLENFALRAD